MCLLGCCSYVVLLCVGFTSLEWACAACCIVYASSQIKPMRIALQIARPLLKTHAASESVEYRWVSRILSETNECKWVWASTFPLPETTSSTTGWSYRYTRYRGGSMTKNERRMDIHTIFSIYAQLLLITQNTWNTCRCRTQSIDLNTHFICCHFGSHLQKNEFT